MQIIKSLILVLFCIPVYGQSGAAMMMVSENSDNQLLFDIHPGQASYSLICTKSNQIDSACLEVRRDNDNALADIGFFPSGDLDTISLKSFCGANSCFASIIKDLSGNEYDLIQPNASEQARIVNSGVIERHGGYPALYFDGTNDYYVKSFTLGSTVSGFLVGTFNVENDCMLDGFGVNNTNSIRSIFGTNDLRLYNTTTGFVRTITYGNRYLISFHANGSTSYLGTNGTYSSGSIGTASMNGITLGRAGGLSSSTSLNGFVQSINIYNSNKYPNTGEIDTILNGYFNVY